MTFASTRIFKQGPLMQVDGDYRKGSWFTERYKITQAATTDTGGTVTTLPTAAQGMISPSAQLSGNGASIETIAIDETTGVVTMVSTGTDNSTVAFVDVTYCVK